MHKEGEAEEEEKEEVEEEEEDEEEGGVSGLIMEICNSIFE